MKGIGTIFAYVLALVLWAGASFAQITPQQQALYDDWIRMASRAEEVVENARASNAALTVLRHDLVEYRRLFDQAREKNASAIRIVNSQLEALGPPPNSETGETEPEEMTNLRAELDSQLDQLRVPVVIAQKAYGRANGLINEIDRIIRDRRTEKLLERGPSPLNAAYWDNALRDLKKSVENLWNETVSRLRLQFEGGAVFARLPLALLLEVVGLALLIRGRRWGGQITDYLNRFGGQGQRVRGFLASLLRILLPFFGLVLILFAIVFYDVLGLRGELLLRAMPQWGATLLGAMWIGERIYARRDEDSFTTLSAARRAQARRNLVTMAVALVLNSLTTLVGEVENLSAETTAVLNAVPLMLGVVALFRFRQVALLNVPPPNNEDGSMGFYYQRIRPALALTCLVVCISAPLLAIAGYTILADAILYPMILTLGVIGLIFLLQSFLTDLVGLVLRKGDSISDTIVPALASGVMILLALPLLAIIWGIEVIELQKLWHLFLQGVQIGDTQFSPVNLLVMGIVFAVGYTATRMLQGALNNAILPKTRLDAGGRNAVVAGTGYVGIFLAALVAITVAGVNLSSLAIVAGALSVGIGFGLQTIVSNFVSGIILLVERPIAEGDWIEVGGQMGYVRDISVRATRIETFDRTDVIVPNADLVSGSVTNYTHGKTVGRVIVPVGVAYGSDTRQVEAILREIAEAHPMVLMNPPPAVVFQGFGADALDFEIRAILRDVNWVLSVKSDINHEINRRFVEEGIEIPFAQRDVWLRNPETLQGAQPATNAAGQGKTASKRPTGTIDPALGTDLSADDGDAGADAGGDGDGGR